MKSLGLLLTGILLLWRLPGVSVPQARIPQSTPVTRTFTATMRYVYHSRQYEPAVSILYVTQRPSKVVTPEAALMAQLSALHKGDYDWWMATWDSRSREKLELRQKQSGQNPGVWLKSFQEQEATGNCSLRTWILRREYVILRYLCTSKSGSPTALARDHAVAFKIDNGEFLATLDLEKDPVFRYANGTNVELEIKPRD